MSDSTALLPPQELFAETRETTAARRNELGALTKSLRALDDAGRLKALPSTMKSFQKEVERLTKRATFAEESYEQLYQQKQQPGSPARSDVDDARRASELAELREAAAAAREAKGEGFERIFASGREP